MGERKNNECRIVAADPLMPVASDTEGQTTTT